MVIKIIKVILCSERLASIEKSGELCIVIRSIVSDINDSSPSLLDKSGAVRISLGEVLGNNIAEICLRESSSFEVSDRG